MKTYGKGCRICVLNYKFAAKSLLHFSTIYGRKNLPHIMAIIYAWDSENWEISKKNLKILKIFNEPFKIALLKTIFRIFLVS